MEGDELVEFLGGIKGKVMQNAQEMSARYNETKTQMSTPASTTSTLVDPISGGGGRGKEVMMDIYGQPWGFNVDSVE